MGKKEQQDRVAERNGYIEAAVFVACLLVEEGGRDHYLMAHGVLTAAGMPQGISPMTKQEYDGALSRLVSGGQVVKHGEFAHVVTPDPERVGAIAEKVLILWRMTGMRESEGKLFFDKGEADAEN